MQGEASEVSSLIVRVRVEKHLPNLHLSCKPEGKCWKKRLGTFTPKYLLSARKVQTAGEGDHSGGGGLTLRVGPSVPIGSFGVPRPVAVRGARWGWVQQIARAWGRPPFH